jgi:cell division protein DivIC
MNTSIRVFTSKYVIALIAFAVWMTFFDARDIPTRLTDRKELQELNAKVEYYRQQINETQNELKNLKNDPATLEKYAREKYLMKKDNEEIFLEQEVSQ